MKAHFTHESLKREDRSGPASERSFALVMAAAFAVLGCLNWWRGGNFWPWLGGTAVLFMVAGYWHPKALRPLNSLWFRFGALLHATISPLILGLVFYGAILPTGLVMRAMGKDLLRLKTQTDCQSYWIVRQPPGPAPQTMKHQF